tara:strand:- start:3278 stop:3925 length:648 start_codon:yes stop_codon:yes gene_type:complete
MPGKSSNMRFLGNLGEFEYSARLEDMTHQTATPNHEAVGVLEFSVEGAEAAPKIQLTYLKPGATDPEAEDHDAFIEHLHFQPGAPGSITMQLAMNSNGAVKFVDSAVKLLGQGKNITVKPVIYGWVDTETAGEFKHVIAGFTTKTGGTDPEDVICKVMTYGKAVCFEVVPDAGHEQGITRVQLTLQGGFNDAIFVTEKYENLKRSSNFGLAQKAS